MTVSFKYGSMKDEMTERTSKSKKVINVLEI